MNPDLSHLWGALPSSKLNKTRRTRGPKIKVTDLSSKCTIAAPRAKTHAERFELAFLSSTPELKCRELMILGLERMGLM